MKEKFINISLLITFVCQQIGIYMTRYLSFLPLLVIVAFFSFSPLHAETTNESDSKQTCQDSVQETKKDDDDEKKDEKPKKVEPPKIGNFSLPSSQQPSGLFGFGANVIDKDEIQLSFFADEFIGKRRATIDLIPSVLFGITDELSVYFIFPLTPLFKDGHKRSSGFEDFAVQFEYAFYNRSTSTYVDQATILGNIMFPTGSTHKHPPTGFGSPSFFVGSTFYRMYVDWFLFVMPGALLTTSNHGTKLGEQFLYQCGIGRNFYTPKGWIYAWMIEVDGQYSKKNRIHGDIDPNSGGNVIYATPSLWISSKSILMQFGVSFPITQNLFGKQHKFDYALNFNFAWSYY